LPVLAPSVGGDYELIITAVQEFVAWFDELDPANALRADVSVR
jgi:hypothetical protein